MDNNVLERLQRRVKDLENAGITTQYSKDGLSWHDSCGTDDVYMRISSDGAATWGNAVMFRGTGQKGDPGKGVPCGGGEGQALLKKSETDYDTEWKSLTTSEIPDSADKRYLTDTQKAVLADTSGVNTGDQTLSGLGGIPLSQKGSTGGVAELDTNGRVPQAQLPSYVDDVLEYPTYTAFPQPGESGKIYVADDTNLAYRWSGSGYVVISPTLALGETMSTAYRGDRGRIAYDHSQLTSGNPHNVNKTDVGLCNVDNVKQVPETRSINGHTLDADIYISNADVGLDNVDDVEQMPLDYLDVDPVLSANSDDRVSSQKAIKTYVDTIFGSAQTSADGKNTIYYQTTQPTDGTYKINDTWFDTAHGNKIYKYDGNSWVAVQFGADAFAVGAITAASGIIADIDASKIVTGALAANIVFAGILNAASGTFTDLIAGVEGAQRLHMGYDTNNEPFIQIYDNTNTLSMTVSKYGLTYGASSRIVGYSIGSEYGIGVFVS